MTGRTLAVVGGGPMCCYAMAHLAALLPEAPPPGALRIAVFDAGGRHGAGEVHSDRQPPVGYLNRVAGQIGFAPDESADPPLKLLPARLRPTFAEWCARKYAQTGDPDFDLRPQDVPRRYVHGLALREMFARYVERVAAVPGVRLELRTSEVVAARRHADGTGFVLVDAEGGRLVADEVLFVTGHSWNTPAAGSEEEALAGHAGYVPTPYPLAQRLGEDAVPPGSAVAVRGFGLAAIDVFLQLTEGRGGRFEPDPGAPPHALRYRPSGREPAVIVPSSPSGIPVSGRPWNAKVGDPARLEHRGVFFRAESVRALRRNAAAGPDGRRRLDFDRHLFPLVVLEMAWVYHSTLLGEAAMAARRPVVDAAVRAFVDGNSDRDEGSGADALVAALESGLGGARFDWRALLCPLPADSARDGDGADWARRTRAYLMRDHADAVEGNLRNAAKAACDGVWRDLRSVFAEAVDFGGLTASSHRRFVREHLRSYNRLSNGAGLEPMRKVLALVDAGLLDLSVGPAPRVSPSGGEHGSGFTVTGTRTGTVRAVDAVVEGRVHSFDPRLDVRPLYRTLLDAGLARLWRNPGAEGAPDFVPGSLDLDEDYHPVLPDGTVEPRLSFLGAPAEGVRVFQTSAARPHSNSTVLAVAARWAADAVQRLTGREARQDDPQAARQTDTPSRQGSEP